MASDATAAAISAATDNARAAMTAAFDALIAADNSAQALQAQMEPATDERSQAQYQACALLRDWLACALNAVNSWREPPSAGGI